MAASHPSKEISSAVSLVTGGARGIGEAVVRSIASQRAPVVFSYRDSESAARKLVEELSGSGAEVLALRCDQRQPEDVRKLVTGAHAWKGRLDHVVANAGIYEYGDRTLDPPELFDRVMETNLRGTYLLAQESFPHLKRSPVASMVLISSILARKNQVGGISYQVSKSGISRLGELLALAFAPRVRVNVVAPGFIRTDMNRDAHTDPEFSKIVATVTPQERWGEPSDVAPVVSFFLGPESSWITGATLGVDGGLSIASPLRRRRKGPRTPPPGSAAPGAVALVTGSSKGIGRAIALELAAAGHSLVLHSRKDRAGAEATADEVRRLGQEAVVFLADLTREADVQQLATSARTWKGRIDTVVSSAGEGEGTSFAEMSREEVRRMLDLHALSAVTLGRELAPALAERHGSLLLNASVAGSEPSPAMVSYSLAKSAALFLTRVMAQEYAPEIRVNAVAPGWVDTALISWMSAEQRERWGREIPLRRIGQPLDVAQAVRFLASERARFVTGQVLTLDGGMTLKWALSGDSGE